MTTTRTDTVVELRTEVRVIQCTNPATREPLGTIVADTPAEVRAAIARARAAQIGWAETEMKKIMAG